MSGVQGSGQREQHMQRSWGRAVPGVLEGQPGGPRGWSRERGKVGGGKAREGTGQSYRALASQVHTAAKRQNPDRNQSV